MGEPAQPSGPISLSHHINRRSRARHPSPLKDIIKYMGQDGMISLAGGLPHPSLFPVDSVTFAIPNPRAIPQDGPRHQSELQHLCVGKDANCGGLNLNHFIQYGTGAGNAELIDIARDLTDRLHAPPYQYECILHPGNTNAWAKVVGLLCEEDDYVICDDYVYPSAQALWIPMGIKAIPVAGDGEGMSAKGLDAMLSSWCREDRGGNRPHVYDAIFDGLYLVPVGSNPTGISISPQRRRDIYEVCVKHDIIIVEDDPYYCLQYPCYEPGATDQSQDTLPTDNFLAALIPSFLSMDYQGRVIRLESFSKTLFPGLRLGYFVANPAFIERLLRATEVETQDPAGLSQVFVLGLLRQWTVDGYLQWLQTLRSQYRMRRDWLVNAIAANFELIDETESSNALTRRYTACVKDNNGESKVVFRFVDPTAGMFLWATFLLPTVSRFVEIEEYGASHDAEQTFASELWEALCRELILLTPGSYYHPWRGLDLASTAARGAERGTCEFRFSFATPTESQIATGIQRLRKVIDKYWV